jgi:hypothetical protein
MLFAAPVAKQFIEKNKDLKITFDVSHWCNVSESLLQDQEENVMLALERANIFMPVSAILKVRR